MALFNPRYDFKAVLPLMGNEYFFPHLPLGGRLKTTFAFSDDDDDDDDDDDELDEFFASKLTHFPSYTEVLCYPAEVNKSVSIHPSNFDVVLLLSTDKRDYLVRNNNYGSRTDHNQVKVASLREKDWVMICCFLCPVFSDSGDALQLRTVSSLCADLYDCLGRSFELVLVLKMKEEFQADEPAFRHLLSGFPSSCLVVPFSDPDSSNNICRFMGFYGRGEGVLLRGDASKVEWHKPLHFFRSYGVDSFPFTDQVIKNINREERNESWNSRSLGNLFCCSPFTVLRKNMKSDDSSETISIRQLQEKLVGVYLCLNGDLIPTLHHIHECCKDANKTFEIVVVYFPFNTKNSDPQLFQSHINRALEKRNISWWVLPFKMWVSLRLKRLCRSLWGDELIIVGKGFADPHCAYVVREFGMRAYPFSKELMFQKEAKRISKVTLASMLVHGERDYVLRNRLDGQDKVPVASLVGKNIFIYICKTVECIHTSLYGPLLKYYSAMMAKDPDMELVYVGPTPLLVSSTTKMPWLICPCDVHHLDLLSKVIFSEASNYLTTLVAFKKDGLVGSIKAHKHLSSRGVEAYPFDNSRLKEEVIDEFKTRFPRFKLDDIM